MTPFRNYSEYESGLPVVSLVAQPDSPSLYDKDYRDEINAELAEITDVKYPWPQAGFEAIAEILQDHGMTLPDISLDKNGEEVLLIKDLHETENPEAPQKVDLFLYLYHEIPSTDDEKCEFYAEIVNEEELEELLDELNDDGEQFENDTNSYDGDEQEELQDDDDADNPHQRRFE